jgi:hypothetical protein
MEGLGCMVADICNGVFEGSTRARILRSRLIAIPKKNGSVRPIAIGECLYRLSALYTLSLFSPAKCFPGIQLGVGHRGGSERAIHLIRAGMEVHGPEAVVISTDWTNAFNARSRADIGTSFFSNANCGPSHRIANFAYSSGSELCVHRRDGSVLGVIMSEQLVRQGDPLSSLAFSLSVQKFYEACAAAYPANPPTCVAIADDFHIVAPYGPALACFDVLLAACNENHFPLNIADEKCKMLLPSSCELDPFHEPSALAARGLKATNALEVLGSFVSFPDLHKSISKAWVKEAVDKNVEFLERLCTARIPLQSSLSILATCGIPRATYRVRTLERDVSRMAGGYFDHLTSQAFARLLDLPAQTFLDSSVAQKQFQLPLSQAGVGAKLTSTYRDAAFLASFCLALPDVLSACSALYPDIASIKSAEILSERMRALTPRFHASGLLCHEHLLVDHKRAELRDFFSAKELGSLVEFPDAFSTLWARFSTHEDMPLHLQSIFQSVVDVSNYEELCIELPEAGRARLLSAKHPLSTLAFRSDIPDTRCKMPDQDFRLAVRLRLGLHLAPIAAEGTCPFCSEHPSLLENPQHPIDCLTFRGEDQRIRHNRIVSLITSFCRQEANCSFVQPEIRLSAATQHRPDLFITTYGGLSFWSDVMVTRPDSATARKAASRDQCSAADAAARSKITKYAALVESHGGGLEILPLCFEVYGAPSSSAKAVFKLLIASAEAGDSSASTCFASFEQLLNTSVSVCLQRGNAYVISSYLKALAARRHSASFAASGTLLVSNHLSH